MSPVGLAEGLDEWADPDIRIRERRDESVYNRLIWWIKFS